MIRAPNNKWKYYLTIALVCCGSVVQSHKMHINKQYHRNAKYYSKRHTPPSLIEHNGLRPIFSRMHRILHRCMQSLQRFYSKKQLFQIKQFAVLVFTSETLTILSNLFDNIVTSRSVASLKRKIKKLNKKNRFNVVLNFLTTVAEPGRNVSNLLILLNLLVFATWNIGLLFGCKRLTSWMDHNFIQDKSKQLPHTAITSAFSHIDLNHFISNMSVLYMFVPDVYKSCKGNKRLFHYFYILSSIMSTSIDNILFRRIPYNFVTKTTDVMLELGEYIMNDLIDSSNKDMGVVEWIQQQRLILRASSGSMSNKVIDRSLGASGILSTMMTFQCLAYPENAYQIGIDKKLIVSAPTAAAVWAFNDFVVLRSADGVGHGVHLGGSLFGAIVHVIIQQYNINCARQKSDKGRKRKAFSNRQKTI
jgi:membrane associated rhomboid family serine protease